MPHLHARILNSASLIVLRTSGKSGKNERQCSLFEHSHQGRRLQLRGSRKKKGLCCRPRQTPKTLTTQGPTSDVRLGHRRSGRQVFGSLIEVLTVTFEVFPIANI